MMIRKTCFTIGSGEASRGKEGMYTFLTGKDWPSDCKVKEDDIFEYFDAFRPPILICDAAPPHHVHIPGSDNN